MSYTLGVQRRCVASVEAAVSFQMLVCTEYLGLSIYINDNGFGNGLFILTGIHFSHVIVGAILGKTF
ncbi:cytochrome C oxidase subunit 3 [Toxoplasma gondii TgCatPRC2]|uniref:Cytochrome C oxidase subunit 3 n=1 Tax=Toxoplasma gondii TgCatPRC2 TaxID=1130821 RepID=A0A151HQS6_TOXGO|nr:cytochrome C oxidase subunit 3 [Toxoplasma gondii TgCatPRC2]